MTWLDFENEIYTDFKAILTNAGFIDGDQTSKEELAKRRKTPFFRVINGVPESQKDTCIIYELQPLNGAKWADNQAIAFNVTIGVDIITPNSLTSREVVEVRTELEEAFENSEDWTLLFESNEIDFDTKKKVIVFSAMKVFNHANE